MAGRFAGWLRARVTGDPHIARQYIAQGRKLLGEVMQRMRLGGLGQLKLREELADGTVIVAEHVAAGGTPILSIDVTGRAEPRVLAVLLAGFVTWPRDADNEDGIDAEHPQVVFTPVGDPRELWASWLFEQLEPFWSRIPRPRSTYGGPYPDGLTHAGNVDWRGAGGLSLSFYGPRGRYLHPTTAIAPGQKVFSQGQLLHDGDAYAAANPSEAKLDWGIVGGGMRVDGDTTYLFLMHRSGTAQALIRYTVDRGSVTPELGDWSVVDASHVVIADWANLLSSVNPWFFNASCTEAVRVVSITEFRLAIAVGSASLTTNVFAPITWGYDVANGEGGGTSTLRVTETILAADFRDDEKVYAKLRVDQHFHREFGGEGSIFERHIRAHFTLVMPDRELELLDYAYDGNDVGLVETKSVAWKAVAFMDLRHDIVAYLDCNFLFDGEWEDTAGAWTFNYRPAMQLAGALVVGDAYTCTGPSSCDIDDPFTSGQLIPMLPFTPTPNLYPDGYNVLGVSGGDTVMRTGKLILEEVFDPLAPPFDADMAVADTEGFEHYGSWASFRGDYCASMFNFNGSPPLNRLSGGDPVALAGLVGADPRFYPIWVLPRAM